MATSLDAFVGDARWSRLFDELCLALRELRDLEPRVADPGGERRAVDEGAGPFTRACSPIGHL